MAQRPKAVSYCPAPPDFFAPPLHFPAGCGKLNALKFVGVAKLADAADLKSADGNIVPVRSRSPAPKTRRPVALRVFSRRFGKGPEARPPERPVLGRKYRSPDPRRTRTSACTAPPRGMIKKDRDALMKASRSLPLRAPPMRQNLRSGWPAGALPGMRPPLPTQAVRFIRSARPQTPRA